MIHSRIQRRAGPQEATACGPPGALKNRSSFLGCELLGVADAVADAGLGDQVAGAAGVALDLAARGVAEAVTTMDLPEGRVAAANASSDGTRLGLWVAPSTFVLWDALGEIAEEALRLAGEICIYTNQEVYVEEIVGETVPPAAATL